MLSIFFWFLCCCFFDLVFGINLVPTLVALKDVLNLVYRYQNYDSILLYVSVFTYSCLSSGSSSFSSTPGVVVAVAAVGVSVVASYSQFVAVVLT